MVHRPQDGALRRLASAGLALAALCLAITGSPAPSFAARTSRNNAPRVSRQVRSADCCAALATEPDDGDDSDVTRTAVLPTTDRFGAVVWVEHIVTLAPHHAPATPALPHAPKRGPPLATL